MSDPLGTTGARLDGVTRAHRRAELSSTDITLAGAARVLRSLTGAGEEHLEQGENAEAAVVAADGDECEQHHDEG